MEYFDIYKKRINRYGTTQQERIQKQREKVFDLKVQNSVYQVKFYFNTGATEEEKNWHYGTLERKSQDNTETLQYLLTKTSLNIPVGTILSIKDLNGNTNNWMIYYLEQIQASGYNKYIVLKMNHLIRWKDREGIERESYGYIYGQEDNMLKDELRSRSRTQVLYTENLKLNFIVMPTNKYIKKDIYFTVTVEDIEEAYVVTGYDIISTPGVMFISMDPTFIRNKDSETVVPHPEKDADGEVTEQGSFWLDGILDDEYLPKEGDE